MTVKFVITMESLLSLLLFCTLCAGTFACFEEHPLEPSLKEYLALKKSCADTLFPEPPCCGSSTEDSTRIVNGVVTGLKELTWNVHITIETEDWLLEPGVFKCTGSLINSLWVLTAAHCFIVPFHEYLGSVVDIGDWNLTSNPDCVDKVCAPKAVNIKAAQVIIHPKYDPDVLLRYDLALLRLKTPVVAYSEFINPICLPLSPLKKECFENQKAIASGWGKTAAGSNTGSPIKLKTTLSVWEEDKCTKHKSSLDEVLDGKIQICASGGNTDTCHGDSGGPLSLKLPNSDNYYLLGVLSGGDPTCDGTKHPGIYGRVDFKWLVNVILNTKAEPEE